MEIIHYRTKDKPNKLNIAKNFFEYILLEMKGICRWSSKEYKIGDNVDYIEFRNCNFGEITSIINYEPKSICVLKKCSIKPFYLNHSIELCNGIFEIVNPNTSRTLQFTLSQTEKAIFRFTKAAEYSIRSIMSNEQIEIYSDYSVYGIRLNNTSELSLYGNFLLKDFYLADWFEKITIGNETNPTEIFFAEITGVYPKLDANHITLTNCKIINQIEQSDLCIKCDKLTGTDFVIQSKSKIYIGDIIVTDSNDENYLTALRNDDEELKRYIVRSRNKEGYITLTAKRYYEQEAKITGNSLRKSTHPNFALPHNLENYLGLTQMATILEETHASKTCIREKAQKEAEIINAEITRCQEQMENYRQMQTTNQQKTNNELDELIAKREQIWHQMFQDNLRRCQSITTEPLRVNKNWRNQKIKALRIEKNK